MPISTNRSFVFEHVPDTGCKFHSSSVLEFPLLSFGIVLESIPFFKSILPLPPHSSCRSFLKQIDFNLVIIFFKKLLIHFEILKKKKVFEISFQIGLQHPNYHIKQKASKIDSSITILYPTKHISNNPRDVEKFNQ